MTTMTQPLIGASLADPVDWNSINWTKASKSVRRLQLRIAKAVREKRWGRVKSLQRILSRSFHAKLLAVKRVTQNKGSKTPGVDNVTWSTAKQKRQAVLSLNHKAYRPKPLRRIYIPKANGKRRPLSIPCMTCRAFQALHLLTLEPVSETLADLNSYGFRPMRSTHDAIEKCVMIFDKRHSSQWVLEADIKSCFDKLSHDWLLANIPLEKSILSKWLKAGFIDKNTLFPSSEGTPQGSIISPTLANMALDGLESLLASIGNKADKIHLVRYADDFIVSGSSKDVLINKVIPAIASFLSERGLSLSDEKTTVTHISEGFDFLGFNIRKYGRKLLTKPSKKSIKSFLSDCRYILKSKPSAKTEHLIRLLNPKIRGWANYFRHASSSKIYKQIDSLIFHSIWRWAKRRHSSKRSAWIRNKYFRSTNSRNWIFSTPITKKGQSETLDLLFASSITIRRHTKIIAASSPYDPTYFAYLTDRVKRRGSGNRVLSNA